jgi:hypothetical protein
MQSFNIPATDDTPRVVLDKENSVFEISGRSLPEDSADFFVPIMEWFNQYRTDPNQSTEFVINLDYFNTASSKYLQDIIATLEGIENTRVVWYYQEEDESMEEAGHEFAELVNIPFEFRTYP